MPCAAHAALKRSWSLGSTLTQAVRGRGFAAAGARTRAGELELRLMTSPSGCRGRRAGCCRSGH